MRWCLLLLLLPLTARASGLLYLDILPTGHIAIDVRINGRGPFHLLLDTGSPVTLITDAAARESGIIDPNQLQGFLSVLTTGTQTNIKTVELAGLLTKDVPVMVLNHPAMAALSGPGAPLVGIAGIPLLSRFRMEIDYSAHRIQLVPNNFALSDILASPSPSPPVLPPLAPAGLWGFNVAEAKDKAPGVMVTEVAEGGAAARAGLRPGDRLLSLGGRWTDTIRDCFRAATAALPAVPVQLRVQRGTERLELTAQCTVGL
jgi:membrane-associated protease RseP (regulator of RpoE activity)